MSVYNVSLLLVFSTTFHTTAVQFKTLYSFANLQAGGVYSRFVTLALLSMAGVPPFIGFFTKLFLFTLLCGSNFFVGFPFFFSILFLGLYFYIQNIRFLNSSNLTQFQPIFEQYVRLVPTFFYFGYFIAFFLIFGGAFLDDLLLVVRWTIF